MLDIFRHYFACRFGAMPIIRLLRHYYAADDDDTPRHAVMVSLLPRCPLLYAAILRRRLLFCFIRDYAITPDAVILRHVIDTFIDAALFRPYFDVDGDYFIRRCYFIAAHKERKRVTPRYYAIDYFF